MTHDLFFSYAHKDRAAVSPIVEVLRAAGLSVWFDESAIESFTSITNSIRSGLASSKALLAYCSTTYPERRACQWELTAAFVAAQQSGQDVRRRILVLNPEPKADHLPFTELRDALFLAPPKPDDDEGLAALVRNVAQHLEDLEEPLGELRTLTPRWFGMKGVAAQRFIGRGAALWEVHRALAAAEAPVITDARGPAVVQIQGMGGLGKTLLAEEYAHRFGAAYPGGVFWLRASGSQEEDLERLDPKSREAERGRQLRQIAGELAIPVGEGDLALLEGQVARALEERGQPALWVVDDLPAGLKAKELRSWLAPHPLARTLITTRSREYENIGTSIALGVLAPEEAFDLLTAERQPAGKEETEGARGVVADLGFHALAVDVAGRYLVLSEGLVSFVSFRESLLEPSRDELELASELTYTLPMGHERSIASTLLRSVLKLGEEGMDLLRLASVLAVVPIPKRLVKLCFSKLLEDTEDPEQASQDRTLKGIQQTQQLSLSEQQGDLVSVHALVSRTFLYLERGGERRQHLRRTAVASLGQDLTQVVDVQARSSLEFEVTHGRALIREITSTEEAELASWIATYDLEIGVYASAVALSRQVLAAMTRLRGPDHPDTLTASNRLAVTLYYQGDFEGAAALQRQVLASRTRLLGPEHPDTLTTRENLATTLNAQGDWKGSAILHRQALHSMKRMLGLKHPSTLSAMNNLAQSLYSQGDPDSAAGLQRQVLESRTRLLGPEHPDTLTTMNDLAQSLKAQGALKDAVELERQALDLMIRLLGPENPKTLSVRLNLVQSLHAQEDFEGAAELQSQALESLTHLLGPEHPDTLAAKSNRALNLYAEGDLEGAVDLQRQILESMTRLLGPDHPNTLTVRLNLAQSLHGQEDFEGAVGLQRQVLESMTRLLGPDHPRTLTARSNLALSLHAQGDLEGAADLQRQVLESRRRLLGPEHSDATIAAWSLFCSLKEVEAMDEANDVFRKALAWLLSTERPVSGEQINVRRMIQDLMEQVTRAERSRSPLARFSVLFYMGPKLVKGGKN